MPSPLDPKPSQVLAFNLTTEVPLLLLPVRLETRFRGNTLLVRVYPDAVHVDSFEPRLTASEVQWGHHFWQQTWLAQNEDQERNAWAQLAQVFGPQRAAWIAKQLPPTNPGDRPTKDNPTKKNPIFSPNPPLVDPTKPHTPCTQLLPDYWVASGTFSYEVNQNGRITLQSESFIKRGRDIKYEDGSDRIFVIPRLDQGITPDKFKTDPHVGWLVDFDKAEQIGMGLTISWSLPLNATFTQINQLYVYGVKASIKPDSGKDKLEALLQAHHHTDGLAFVRQGTPTNNTLAASSGYSSGDPGAVESFEVERKQKASTNPDDLPNLLVMAEALGIDPACLTNIREANAVEQRDARDMNDLLWKSTWKYFLEQMLELGGQHAGKIDQMRDHFVKYVRALGPLPTLRIGRQPYGVLPVSLLGEPGLDSVTTGPVACLRALREIWREFLQREDLVPRLKKGSDISLTLLQVLAMAPTGISYVGRPCTRVTPLSSPLSSDAAKTGVDMPDKLKEAFHAFGIDPVTPHQRMLFAAQSNVFSLSGPLVSEHDFKETGVSSLLQLLRDPNNSSNSVKYFKDKIEKTKEEIKKKSLPPTALDDLLKEHALLLQETLDLCSHRLDAWITSLATKRLDQLREKKPKGISIGGYGWVENLTSPPRPGSSSTPVIPKNYGFIHAPSLAHATTAAVLRSGYLSRKLSETPIDSNALAINLSSERVRLALHLIDGVRGGQSLGSLLGYRFERGLHERGLDRFIPAFRKIAPGSTELISPADPSDAAKAKLKNLVLDGLKLLETPINWNSEDFRTATGQEKSALESELTRLKDAVDAVADLALAESVHHVAQGNPVRAGATLEAIARGEAPPPELDFIRTPRTGINHTHRISVIFGTPPTVFPWGITTPRAQAEPVLNAWVAQLLGLGAEEAACTAKYTDPMVSGEQPLPVKIKDLGLAPLDLVYLPDGEVGGRLSEIEQRILYHVLKTRPSITNISLTFNASTGGTPPGFTEILEVARTIRRLITGARVLEPRDVDLPENVLVNAPSDADPSLIARASVAREAFVKAIEDLRKALPGKPEDPITNPSAVQEALKGLAAYGLMGAIPVIPLASNESPERGLKNLHAQALSVLEEATLRDKRAQASPTPIQNNAQAIAVLHEIFGQDFSALPAFTPKNGADLNQTFAKSTALQGGNPLASITWFQRIARVRDGTARLDATMQYTEALNGPMLSFQVGQLPSRDGEQWLALENPPQGNRLSLACITTVTDFTKPVAGLLVDEWVEMVPNKDEVTGLAFHFDAPQPRAPQALLLAMAPEGVDKWDSVILENTLRETLELAKLRAVDLTALGKVGQYLPAMYFANDAEVGRTLSTTFKK